MLKKVDIIVDGDEGLVGYEESAVDKGLTEIAKQYDIVIGNIHDNPELLKGE